MPRSRHVELAVCAVYSLRSFKPRVPLHSTRGYYSYTLSGFLTAANYNFGIHNNKSARRSPFRDPIAIGWGVLPFRVRGITVHVQDWPKRFLITKQRKD